MTLDITQFYQTFFDEADELLAQMEQLLLNLDVGSPDPEDLAAIFRAAHSIKGGAATFGFSALTETTHILESLLDRARNHELTLTKEMVDAFLETKDVLSDQLADYRASAEPDAAAAAAICAKLERLKAESGTDAPAAVRQLDLTFANRITTVCSNAHTVEAAVRDADVVIGAVLVPGASAPRLVTRDMIATMRAGAVVVDVAIDQGGCFETSHPTTHAEPTFVVDGVVHYCVANMPGAVARTSTFALNNATLGHALALADNGWKRAMTDDPHLRAGLNVCDGHITYEAVAHALGLPYVPATDVLA